MMCKPPKSSSSQDGMKHRGNRRGRVICCPRCGGETERLRRSEYSSAFFLLQAPRRCQVCGLEFHPPCSRVLAVTGVIVGGLFVILSILAGIVPAVRNLYAGNSLAASLVNLALATYCTMASGYMLLVSGRCLGKRSDGAEFEV
jgi:hypothetical protein